MTVSQLSESQSISLDLIRYLLAAIVVIGHGFGFFLGYFDNFFPEIFPYPQSIAVVCFFYLSGFLIVGSQIRQIEKGEASLKRYLYDRVARVYVTLIPSLIFVLIVDVVFLKSPVASSDLVLTASDWKVLVKNVFLIPSMPYGTMRPVWSLMYEWWIYLLFGGICFFRRSPSASLFLIIFGLYHTIFVNGGGEAGHIWVVWMAGGLCAYFQKRLLSKVFGPYTLSAALIVFLIFATGIYCISKNAYDLLAGIFLGLSIFMSTNLARDFSKLILPLGGAARILAGYSFTLFLTHYTVLVFTKEYLKIDGWMGLMLGFIFSNLMAFLIALFTEYKLSSIKLYLNLFGRALLMKFR